MLAVGDGAMGLWTVLDEVFPQVRDQRSWFHKIGNALNEVPISQHAKAKAALAEISNAATRAQAIIGLNRFVDTYAAKYPKAVAKLTKDRATLLRVLRLSGGALATRMDYEPNRVNVRDGVPSHVPHAQLPVERAISWYSVQADRSSRAVIVRISANVISDFG